MRLSQKPLNEQVIVITGASSGIALAAAELAADRGSALVLAGRSETELAIATARIRARGGRVAAVAADVADRRQVAQIGIAAMRQFGCIDTWVNSAGLGVFGRRRDQPAADPRQLFETNFRGIVHGCNVAAGHMRSNGGTIVNIAGDVSDRGAPLLAETYAVRGYTDALRMEFERLGIPIRVSVVEPGLIDAPLLQHAPNDLDQRTGDASPAYRLEDVARAILECAELPAPEIAVGRAPRLQIALATLAPRLTGVMKERQTWNQGQDVMKSAAATRAALSDVGRALPLVALGAIVAAGVAASRRQEFKS